MSSKIKVDTIENVAGSGNVSLGSGHNLVVPGNQTVGGTLGVTGVSTFSGNIGKVSSGLSPEIDIHVKTASGNPEVRVESTGANYATYGLKNSSRAYSTQIRTDQSNAYVIRDETGGGNRLLINTSGAVTIPNQPHVRATVASGTTAINFTSNGNTTVPYNQILENNGNHYNTSNYLFTCPVSGVYAVYAALQASNVVQAIGQVAPNLSIQRNSTRTSGTYDWVAQANYKKLECTAFIKCSANDTLAINLYDGANSTSGSTEFNGDARNIFMVTLLG
jgi:hypothetical protein